MISRISHSLACLALFAAASVPLAAPAAEAPAAKKPPATAAGQKPGQAVDQALVDRLHAVLDNPEMGLKVAEVRPSEIPGIYAVQFDNGPLVYATEDGQYFIAGDMWQVNDGVYVNLGDQQRSAERKAQLAAVDKSDMIIFSPEGEARSYVTVFTDVTCFYCQKLHKEVPELNKRGVEVRYLAFPRAGIGSAAYHQLVTAWCSDNPQDALTRLKNKEVLPPVKCEHNPVAQEYQLGQRLGVRGTPALILPDGTMIPGYQSADQLIQTLGLQ